MMPPLLRGFLQECVERGLRVADDKAFAGASRLPLAFWLRSFRHCGTLNEVPRPGVGPGRPDGHPRARRACLPVPAPGHNSVLQDATSLWVAATGSGQRCPHKVSTVVAESAQTLSRAAAILEPRRRFGRPPFVDPESQVPQSHQKLIECPRASLGPVCRSRRATRMQARLRSRGAHSRERFSNHQALRVWVRRESFSWPLSPTFYEAIAFVSFGRCHPANAWSPSACSNVNTCVHSVVAELSICGASHHLRIDPLADSSGGNDRNNLPRRAFTRRFSVRSVMFSSPPSIRATAAWLEPINRATSDWRKRRYFRSWIAFSATWNEASLRQPRWNSGDEYKSLRGEGPSTDSDSTIECRGKEVPRSFGVCALLRTALLADCEEVEDSLVVAVLLKDMEVEPPTTRFTFKDSDFWGFVICSINNQASTRLWPAKLLKQRHFVERRIWLITMPRQQCLRDGKPRPCAVGVQRANLPGGPLRRRDQWLRSPPLKPPPSHMPNTVYHSPNSYTRYGILSCNRYQNMRFRHWLNHAAELNE